MLKNESAFSTKRKIVEEPLCSQKKKIKQEVKDTNKKIIAENTKEPNLKKQQLKHKCTLNVTMKNKKGVATKTGKLKIFKNNLLPDVKKAQKKSKIVETQQNKVNNVNIIHKKTKLKKKKLRMANKTDFNKKKTTDIELDPIMHSQKLLEWLIYPLNVKNFFTQNWENTPVHIKRNNPHYYEHLMSTPLLDKILREHNILFSKNIDVTSYSDGKRETHNPPGRALPSVIWDYYQNKCSIRMINPQSFIPQLHTLNATLQELFGCFVGANSYLTPPNSQGFAPHYDDIEAFILQIEGQKRWRLYKPSENEYLARFSSNDFDQSEIGEPIFDTIVNAGDLLYFPRGTIHQGMTVADTHSLHVTISMYQRNSWCDLLEKLLPQALQHAVMTDSRFREGLPLNYLNYTGIAYDNDEPKEIFKKHVKDLLMQLIDYIDVDSAADLMAKNHMHDFLPPVLNKNERRCSVMEDGDIMIAKGIVKNSATITTETKIRLIRAHCIRLIEEDNMYKIYYSTENSKVYHEYELQYLDVEERFVPLIKSIITSYPKFVCVNELPLDNNDEKIQIVSDLWEKNLVITDVPLGTSSVK